MKALVLLTACGLATITGCQVSDDRDVDTTNRPSAGAEMTASYTMPYEATQDTEWAASAEPSAQRGTIRQGERAMFSREPNTSMEWQQAQVNGTTRYVRPAAFRKATVR